MKAELKNISSPDIPLDVGPSDSNCFSFYLEAFIGPTDNTAASDRFGFIVCTPNWIEKNLNDTVFFGNNLLVIHKYDLGIIKASLQHLSASVRGSTWLALANQLARFGDWEFANYRSYAPKGD